MKFQPNISPIDVTKKGAFGGTYFRNIYSNITDKFYKNTWEEFKEFKKILIKNIIVQIFMMLI